MDIRGIEVTNQLRSAIRAKLLELGVRYDEELPDYILVMVVNKKSRQQMHDDLHLFLEDCTSPFVDWLHDQVLKKLQKVTVAKKKSLREFVPTVVVKQEEERKKKKISTTSFLEDQAGEQVKDKSHKPDKSQKPIEKPSHKENSKSNSSLRLDAGQKEKAKFEKPPEEPVKRPTLLQENVKPSGTEDQGSCDTQSVIQISKRATDATEAPREVTEKKLEPQKCRDDEKKAVTEEVDDKGNSKKLKSCVNKLKITSVVSVKNRLGVVSPRKKFEIYRQKQEERYRQQEKRRFDSRNGNFQRRGFEEERRRRDTTERTTEATKYTESEKPDVRNRLGNAKKSNESREKTVNLKSKIPEKATVKGRLGTMMRTQKNKDGQEFRTSKTLEQSRESFANNVKTRLGPLKNLKRTKDRSSSSEDEDCLDLAPEEELDDEKETVKGPIKSHIIAVNKQPPAFRAADRKRTKEAEDTEEEIEDTKIPSKVIVTPRPLKPLQPTQKRATQSLLFRAVAEANQSVVTKKNPEPCLTEKKPLLKRLQPPGSARNVSQNLSVHLNATKRLVMEKIQVELNTADVSGPEAKPSAPQPVTDEHMGVVMSLFQRTDNNQKFLVTLNGCNNNLKEKNGSDDEERLEMEVNEEDELALLNTQTEPYIPEEPDADADADADADTDPMIFRIIVGDDETETAAKDRVDENNENRNTENVEKTNDVPRKRRKLSPIVYNMTHSPSPELKHTTTSANQTPKRSIVPDKKPLTENSLVSVIDKSREKCRYWPNCTLGNKCAYLHPPVMCSAFPACKFGDKCAYRHPKCKFGLSCTKLGCIFSHPAQQCKYHPFCTKPACPYSHPGPANVAAALAGSDAAVGNQRAKFSWRRRY